MLKELKRSYQSIFSDPEASILALFILFILIIVFFMGQILKPVLVSIVIAYLLDGIVDRFKLWKIPHVLSVLIVYFLFLGLVVVAFVGILPLVWNQSATFIHETPAMFMHAQTTLQKLPMLYPDIFTPIQIDQWTDSLKESAGTIGQFVLSNSVTGLTNIITAVIYFILVPFLIYFFLMDKVKILNWATVFTPHKRTLIKKVWADINKQFAAYIRGRVLEIIIGIIVHYVLFLSFGLKYSLLLAVAVGLSVVIPYIGVILATIPVFLVAFIQWGAGDRLLTLSIIYASFALVTSQVIEPLLFSSALALHPIAIIVSTLVCGSLFGFWGIFFAIPLASVVKAIITAWPKAPRSS